MNSRFILAALAIAGTVLWLSRAHQRPSLPPELAGLQCARGLDSIVEVGGTRLLASCNNPLESGNRAWSTWLRRTPQGQLAPSGVLLSPKVHDAQWVMVASAFPDAAAFEEWRKYNDVSKNAYYEPVEVASPPAFAATGPRTTFLCSRYFWNSGGGSLQTLESNHSCYGELMSGRTHWGIKVSFGEPLPREFDMRPGLLDAYRVLAAHIIRPG